MNKTRLINLLHLPGVVLLCLTGLIFALLNLNRAEAWCLLKLRCYRETNRF
jgi:hypothetical protein